ncbi:hypothetical protein ACEPAH_6551 [Sanghuangporus vaninii]
MLSSWRSRRRQLQSSINLSGKVPPSSTTFTSNISAANPMPIPITDATQGPAKIHGFVPRSTDSDATTPIAAFSVLGGLFIFFQAIACFRWLIWRHRSRRAKKGRRDHEALNHDNSCATEETCADLSDGDDLRRGYETETQIPVGRNPRANEAGMSTYAAAPDATVQQTVGEAVVDSSAHPLESLPQSDATQQTSTTLSEGVPDIPNSSGRTISLMQREIDELRARVDELTRRQQPESSRHFSASLSDYSDARTSLPSYSEVGNDLLRERQV